MPAKYNQLSCYAHLKEHLLAEEIFAITYQEVYQKHIPVMFLFLGTSTSRAGPVETNKYDHQ